VGDDDVTEGPGHLAVESHDADVDGFRAVVACASRDVGGEETTEAFRLDAESNVFAQLCDGLHHAVVGEDPVAAGVAFLVLEDVVDGVVCERLVAALGMVACEFPVDEDLDGGGDEAELEANLVSHVTGGELHGLRERDHRVSGGRAFAPERVHGYRDLGGELADVWVLGVVVAESHGGGPHALELYVYNVQYHPFANLAKSLKLFIGFPKEK